MKKSLIRSYLISTSIILPAFTMSSHAAITVDITDDGVNTSVRIQGSIDPSGLSSQPDGRSTLVPVGLLTGGSSSNRIEPGLSPTFGSLGIATNLYTGATSSMATFTTVNVQGVTLAALPLVWIANGGQVLVADELLTSGGSGLTYRASIPGTLSSRGIIDGVISSTSWTTASGASESVSFRTGSAVPEPSTGLLGAIGMLWALRRRR